MNEIKTESEKENIVINSIKDCLDIIIDDSNDIGFNM